MTEGSGDYKKAREGSDQHVYELHDGIRNDYKSYDKSPIVYVNGNVILTRDREIASARATPSETGCKILRW